MLMIAAVLAASGTHWAILQSLAWTTMLVQNLESKSVREAVVETFDGKHPCRLCKAISTGKKSEKKKEFVASWKQPEFIPSEMAFIFEPPHSFTFLPDLHVTWHELGHKPLLPPPRVG